MHPKLTKLTKTIYAKAKCVDINEICHKQISSNYPSIQSCSRRTSEVLVTCVLQRTIFQNPLLLGRLQPMNSLGQPTNKKARSPAITDRTGDMHCTETA